MRQHVLSFLAKTRADEVCALLREDRVRKGADKLKARLSAKQQGRLDGFFTVAPKEGGAKRKVRHAFPALVARANSS